MRSWLEPRPLPRRPLWLAGGWLLVAAVVLLSLWPDLPQVDVGLTFIDKFGHASAYAALMAYFGFIYRRRSHATIFVLLTLLGIALEFAQWWSGKRMFELYDIGANVLGITLGLVFIRAIAFRR